MRLVKVLIYLFNIIFYSGGIIGLFLLLINPKLTTPVSNYTLNFIFLFFLFYAVFITCMFLFFRCPHCKTRVILKAFQIDWKSEVLDISPKTLSKCPTCGKKLYD